MTPIEQLKAAIENPGQSPGRHLQILTTHRNEWPTLWKAIDRILEESLEEGVEIPRDVEPDARVWSEWFVGRMEEDPSIATSVGAMSSWFSGAILSGYEAGQRQAEVELMDSERPEDEDAWVEGLDG